MKFDNKVYNVLKWICIAFIPAAIIFLNTCLPVWGVPTHITDVIVTTMAALAEFIGALIAVSNYNYYKDRKTE